MIQLRAVTEIETALAMKLINQAKDYFKLQGIDQWQRGYPDLYCIEEDIKKQTGFFLVDGDDVVGYLCVDFGGEAAYATLKGTWQHDGAYCVVHRLTIDPSYRGRGIAHLAFALVQVLCKQNNIHSIRVDTDAANQAMQHILAKNGYAYRGTIWFDNSEKIAFEKYFGV